MYTLNNGVKTPVDIAPATDGKKTNCFLLYCLFFIVLIIIGFLIWKMFDTKNQPHVGYRLY